MADDDQAAIRASDALWIAIGALALAILIVLRLIEKGILGSWLDLLSTAKAASE